MDNIEDLITCSDEIEGHLSYEFTDKKLLALAFVHRSFVNESSIADGTHNERLEFLGDSVLGMLIAAYLYTHFPEKPEGDLSTLRSRLVEASSCVMYIRKLDVEQYILLSKGEQRNEGRGRDSILADLFEAIIGAIYIDGGTEAAQNFLFGHFQEDIDAIISEPFCNWKADLQDLTQRRHQETPTYKVLKESGPDHDKVFEIGVFISDRELGRGTGESKKVAQQAAAALAIDKLKDESST